MSKRTKILTEQILKVIGALGWCSSDFVIRPMLRSVSVIRVIDQTEISIPTKIVKKCNSEVKLRKIIVQGFSLEPECEILPPVPVIPLIYAIPTTVVKSTQVLQQEDLVVTKLANKTFVLAGDVINFTFIVQNASTTTSYFIQDLQDFLSPLAGTFTTLPPDSTLTSTGFLANINRTLTPLSSFSTFASWTASPQAVQTTYTNIGAFRATGLPAVQASVDFAIGGLTITKTADRSTVSTGELITFTIQISNIASISLSFDGFLRDTVTASGSFVSMPPGAIVEPSGFRLPLDLTLVPGQTMTYTAVFQVAASTGNYVNTASLITNLGTQQSAVTFGILSSWILSRVFTQGIRTKLTQVEITHDYTDALQGFSFIGTEEQAQQIQSQFPGSVLTQDVVAPLSEFDTAGPDVCLRKQEIGQFIERIGADHNSGFSNQLRDRSDINVFIIDTGIYPHIDLNVVGGINVSQPGENDDWVDRNGHGTHVAGIVGAINNNIGIVGVSPGVRLWAIKTVSDDGTAFLSNALAGMDWILRNRGITWSGYGLLNVSLNIPRESLIDEVVATITNNGLPVIVSAGDTGSLVQYFSPAGSPGAITVGSTSGCYDTLANFSNVGRQVALLAPGSGIVSTLPENKYGRRTGTATSAPIVTGTVAILISTGTVQGEGAEFVSRVRNRLICDSKEIHQQNADGTKSRNPRIDTRGKPVTNVSVWAGAY